MKRQLIGIVLLLNFFVVSAQKFSTKTGNLKFEASVISFEEVAAENKNTAAILQTTTGDLAIVTLVKGFQFKIALMQEHFNENYMESEKFPKAYFKGKIENFKLSDLTQGVKNLKLQGDLTIHGKSKKIVTVAKVQLQENKLVLTGNFEVKPEEFGIEIPKLLTKKVAERVKIMYSLALQEQ